jgi:hypothetical protein
VVQVDKKTYKGTVATLDVESGSGTGASLPLFFELYEYVMPRLQRL